MEIAEAEITRAQELYPDHRDQVWEAFGVLVVPATLESRLLLYRVYAREICERIGRGCPRDKATIEPTAAEMLAALAEVSMRVPLTRAGYALYASLFQRYREALDPQGTLDFPNAVFDYEGQDAELLDQVRRAVLKARAR